MAKGGRQQKVKVKNKNYQNGQTFGHQTNQIAGQEIH